MKSLSFNNLTGFADGRANGEFCFSTNMTRTRLGLAPYWSSTISADSSTLTDLNSVIQWFAQVGDDVYGMDSTGDIYKSELGLLAWAKVHTNAQTNLGNGLIGDQKGRLLYVGERYIGKFDGTTWTDNWLDCKDTFSDLVPTTRYEDVVLLGRKNKVLRINADDSLNDSTNPAFDLPSGFNITSICGGRTGVLIGANLGRSGSVILWDNYSTRSIAPWIPLEDPVLAIIPAFGEWMVITDREAFLTNGYSKGKSWPMVDQAFYGSYINVLPQGALVARDKLVLANTTGRFNRVRSGFHILDLTTGFWEFVLPGDRYTGGVQMGAVFCGGQIFRAHTSFSTTIPNTRYIGQLLPNFPQTAYYITEPLGDGTSKKTAKEVQLQLLPFNQEDVSPALTFTVTAKIYDYSRPLWNYATAKTGSEDLFALDTLIVDGTIGSKAQIGDEVTIGGSLFAGQIRHIKTITGQGTATERWILDTPLTDVSGYQMPGGTRFLISPFRSLGSITVTNATDLTAIPFTFPDQNDTTGSRFLVKVLFEDVTYGPVVAGGTLLYEDLGVK